MTIEKQLKLLDMVEQSNDLNLKEIRITLEDCQRLVNEQNREMRAHIYHFMRQRLTGYVPPVHVDKKEEQVVPELMTGNWFRFMGQTLQFVTFQGPDILALDKTGKERTIPKIRWKEITKL